MDMELKHATPQIFAGLCHSFQCIPLFRTGEPRQCMLVSFFPVFGPCWLLAAQTGQPFHPPRYRLITLALASRLDRLHPFVKLFLGHLPEWYEADRPGQVALSLHPWSIGLDLIMSANRFLELAGCIYQLGKFDFDLTDNVVRGESVAVGYPNAKVFSGFHLVGRDQTYG